MTEPTTHTLHVPGAVLTYDVRRNDSSSEPVLLIIGSPMGASGFVTLAGHFADRTVVTYDPRGAGAAGELTTRRRARSRSMRMICIGSSSSSKLVRSISSPPAVGR